MAVELSHALLGRHQFLWLAACAAALGLLLALALLAAQAARRRMLREGDVPTYWEHAGQRVKGVRGKAFFDDAFPVSLEQRQALQELMNATCSVPDEEAFRLVRAVRVESSVLWARYRRKLQATKEVRGACQFTGSGAPSVLEAVAELEDTAAFSSDVDVDACESYLWLGTSPETAMSVIHHGLLPAAGAEGDAAAPFGGGWYFSDDMAKADRSARAGVGIYKECVAMLLCRVILGKQQLVTELPPPGAKAARPVPDTLRAVEEGAASAADGCAQPQTDSGQSATFRSRLERLGLNTKDRVLSVVRGVQRLGDEFDSTLVELPEQSRVFIVSESSQVYPEYAICYERCQPDHLESGLDAPTYWEHARSLLFGTTYPPYWTNCRVDAPADFHDLFPAMKFPFQKVVDGTWKHKRTRDRLGHDGRPIPKGDPHGDMPVGLRVLRGWRVESGKMWSSYKDCEAGVQHRRGSCTAQRVQSVEKLPLLARRRLNSAVNEAYLWHGSSPVAVLSIAMGGFNLDLSGSNVGAMFGRGAYLAECASKADEYSRDDKEGYYKGCFAMLLCRVVLGEAQVLQEANYSAHERTGPNQTFDSTIGDRESAVGTYREFVVPSQQQIYPEYAIIYERLYRGGPRVR